MKELIIYDTTGYIYFRMVSPCRVPIGIPYMEVDVPTGKMVTSIDVSKTPNVPVLEDIPKSETEVRMEALEASNAELMNIIATIPTTS